MLVVREQLYGSHLSANECQSVTVSVHNVAKLSSRSSHNESFKHTNCVLLVANALSLPELSSTTPGVS